MARLVGLRNYHVDMAPREPTTATEHVTLSFCAAFALNGMAKLDAMTNTANNFINLVIIISLILNVH
jgi:hypothetical protein